MKRFLCKTLPRPEVTTTLDPTESHHLLQVLRLRPGSMVEAIDGKGNAVLAKVQPKGKGLATLEYAGLSELVTSESSKEVVPLVLEAAILKGEAMSWSIEKAVELGVQEFIPLLTERTVVRVSSKGPEVFASRWQKIADQALKQCGRLNSMKVHLPMKLDQLFSEFPSKFRLVALESAKNEAQSLSGTLRELGGHTEAEPLRILVGPEGGFSPQEEELLERSGVRAVSLGPLILRADTASVYSASLAAAFLREPENA